MSIEINTDHTSSMTFLCKQPKQKCFQLLRTQNKNCVAPGVAPHVPFRTWSPAVVSPSLEQLKDKGESVEMVEFYNWNLKNKRFSLNM